MTRSWNPSFYGHQQDGPLLSLSAMFLVGEGLWAHLRGTFPTRDGVEDMVNDAFGGAVIHTVLRDPPVKFGREGAEVAKRAGQLLRQGAQGFYGNVSLLEKNGKYFVQAFESGKTSGSIELDLLHYDGVITQNMELDPGKVKAVWGFEFGKHKTALESSEDIFQQWLRLNGSSVKVVKKTTPFVYKQTKTMFEELREFLLKQKVNHGEIVKTLTNLSILLVGYQLQSKLARGFQKLMEMGWNQKKKSDIDSEALSTILQAGGDQNAAWLTSFGGVDWADAFATVALMLGSTKAATLRILQAELHRVKRHAESEFPYPANGNPQYEEHLREQQSLIENIREYGGIVGSEDMIHSGRKADAVRAVQTPPMPSSLPVSAPRPSPIPRSIVENPRRKGDRRLLQGDALKGYLDAVEALRIYQESITNARRLEHWAYVEQLKKDIEWTGDRQQYYWSQGAVTER